MKANIDYKIITLPVKRWREYKDLRLEALKLEPQAFAMEYSKEANRPDADWIDRLKPKYQAAMKLFLEVDGALAGIIGSFCDENDPHTAIIILVYVKKEYRGLGLGKAMLRELLDKLSKLSEINKFQLSVTATQIPAIKTYESLGFKEISCKKNEVLFECKYYDEIVMEKPNVILAQP